jgi:response regulator RpfG family c-di-GMP phosphodiesterase
VPTSRPAANPSKAKLICEALVRDKLIAPDQLDTLLGRADRAGERVEDIALELGLVKETDLLKSLAATYKVHFISSEKLAKVEVGRALLGMLPQRFAEKIGMCPIVFDPKTHALTIITADPDDIETLREVQLASGAREVKVVLARPAAVKALIAKVYTGDPRAFALLERQAHAQMQSILSAYERNNIVLDDSPPAPPPPPRAAESKPRSPERVPRKPSPAAPPLGPPPAPALKTPPAANASGPPQDKGISNASFLELLHVLVSLLESSRADLRGHSAQVGRLMRRVAEKLGLDPGATAMMVAAAFIHDLGKMGQYHLTTLNCSEYDGHKAAAQKSCGIPARLLEPVRLPAETLEAVARMYERYDGKGFPDGMAGKDIPLGSRILAVCDTYADLTTNPRNPFRRVLGPEDACNALTKYKDSIFDPILVDLLKTTVLGEELAARLLSTRFTALVVDVDPEESTVLELRMMEQGFIVKTARSAEQAMKVLAEGTTDLVVSEIELAATDGLALLAEARKEPWGRDLPWVMYTRRQERAVAQRAFDLGVLDYVTKPASTDVLVAKLRALLEQRSNPRNAQGVSGSLREMGLPDMVQVLFHGRKSGNLKIRARDGSGEIHFMEGNVVNATWGELRGEDAFFAMLKIQDGDFGLDPSFKTEARVIHQSSEALLLEGMRRMDEGLP